MKKSLSAEYTEREDPVPSHLCWRCGVLLDLFTFFLAMMEEMDSQH